MNKKVLFIIFAVIVLAAAGIGYLAMQSEETMDAAKTENTQQTAPPTETTEQEQPQAPPAEQPSIQGQYRDYSADSIATTDGVKILFFHAPWCPQCRQLDASIKTSGVPAGVTIFKVDYDTSQSLRQKYGVTIQTTLVKVDDQGNLIKKFVAYDDPSIEAVKQNLL